MLPVRQQSEPRSLQQRGMQRATDLQPSTASAASFTTSYAGVVAFMAVVSEGNFAKAADRLGIGRSAVSRGVQRLEAQLGARLFSRTTRSLSLTREGELFHAHCQPGVDQISQALESMRELRQGPPRGQLRIRSTAGFGRKVVAPLLWKFHSAYPAIELELLLDDRPTDFTVDRIDISFRDGRMEDSQVVARQLAPMQMLACASPEYARIHGLPYDLDDLSMHRCINLRLPSGRVSDWEFRVQGKAQKLSPRSVGTFNDADVVLQAVLDGQGIAQLAGYQASDLLRTGQLVTCLAQYAPDDRGHYICYLSREHLPTRMRVFIDFMTSGIRALDLNYIATLT